MSSGNNINHQCHKHRYSCSGSSSSLYYPVNQATTTTTTTTVVEDDDEDIVDYNIICDDIKWSANVIRTWIHYRQDEILSDTPSGLSVLLCSLDEICPDQVTMDKINTYLVEHIIHEKEFSKY